MFFLFIFLTSR